MISKMKTEKAVRIKILKLTNFSLNKIKIQRTKNHRIMAPQ